MNTTIQKPAKPSADFPLYAHGRQQWAKKIAGKTIYFGPWGDPAAALAAYHRYLDTGSVAPVQPTLPTVAKPAVKAKPGGDFPLYPHKNGQWTKRINGTLHYFGTDQNQALDLYLEQKEDLYAGRNPVQKREGQVTINELVNRYLGFKKQLRESGELGDRTYKQYEDTCQLLIETFGRSRAVEALTPLDFEGLRKKLAETNGVVAIFGWINRIRGVFKYGRETLDLGKTNYGRGFDKPTRKVLRKARKEKGKKMLTADQIRKVIERADVQLEAMILLGINCGFGNEDCSTLKREHLDLERGHHTYWRPKTGVDRAAPLWPETIAALRRVLNRERRPVRRDEDKDLVFLTRCGQSWSKSLTAITQAFNKLLEAVGAKRKGVSFYALRHTFETIGGNARDPMAVDFVMGHTPHSDDMRAVYTEEIDDERLRRVTDFVRSWLFADQVAGGGKPRLAVHRPGDAEAEAA